jgi:hypothetical protein
MAYGQNMKAPNSGIASLMAMRGRQGDNTLVHVNPMELRALNSMAPGGLTQNPATGLPEAFKLKDILPVLGGIAGAAFLGPLVGLGGGALATGVGSGIGAAAGTAAAGGNREEILTSGLGSGLTAGLFAGAGGAGKAAEGVTQLGTQGTEGIASSVDVLKAAQSTGIPAEGLTTALGRDAFSRGAYGELGKLGVEQAGLKGLTAAGVGATIPAMFETPDTTVKGAKPIQSIRTEQRPIQDREEIDRYIRQGGVMPPFFDPNPFVTQPGIYRQDGGQTSSEMFAGRVMSDEGDGMSDNVKFEVVGDPQIDIAMLSPDEHVISAAEVAAIGNGSTNVGHRKLEEFRQQLREARGFEKEGPQEVDSNILDNLA